MIRKTTLLLLLLALSANHTFGQKAALKTNLLYIGSTYTPNLSLEIGLGRRSTLDIGAGYNPWNLKGENSNNKKLVHWLGTAEYRYWFCEKFNGHFIGGHALGSQYNISGHNLPLLFGKGSKDYRYQGWAVGGGVSYGYQWVLGKHWNLEATVGVGYAYLNYDQYNCGTCGSRVGSGVRHYIGPTKAGVSLIYTF